VFAELDFPLVAVGDFARDVLEASFLLPAALFVEVLFFASFFTFVEPDLSVFTFFGAVFFECVAGAEEAAPASRPIRTLFAPEIGNPRALNASYSIENQLIRMDR
jgi:hypothetical protein